MVKRRLPIRDLPRSDERACDYINRIALLNGYGSSKDAFVSVSDERRTPFEELRDMIDVNCDRLDDLVGPWPAWVDRNVSDQSLPNESWLNRRRYRWCPICLGEDRYVRGIWSWKLFVACPNHGVLLREACDKCSHTFSWRYALRSSCTCGRGLADMHSIPAERDILEIMGLCVENEVPRLSGPNPQRGTGLRSLSCERTQRLLHRLAPLLPGTIGHRSGSIPKLYVLQNSLQYVRECVPILSDWPNGFRTWLRQYAEARCASPSIRRTFGRLYYVLYSRLRDPEFDFMRTEFEDYLALHWQGTIDGRFRSLASAADRLNNLSGNEIRKRLSCSRKTTLRLVETGTLCGTALFSPMGRAFVVADMDSVDALRVRLANLVDLRKASGLLGLSRSRVRALLTSGLMRSTRSLMHNGQRWHISLEELRRWMSIISKGESVRDSQDVVTLAHVFKYRCPTNLIFLAIAQALIDGKLKCWQADVNSGKLTSAIVRSCDVRRIAAAASPGSTDGLTAQAVAAFLSIKEEVVYQLMRTGHLQAAESRVGGKPVHLITREALHAFSKKFVALAEVARYWRTSPRHALVLLEAYGLRPSIGPPIDGCRQYFVERSAIEAREDFEAI